MLLIKAHEDSLDISPLRIRMLQLFLYLLKLAWGEQFLERSEVCLHPGQVARIVELLLTCMVVKHARLRYISATELQIGNRKRVALCVGKHDGLFCVHLNEVVLVHLLHDSPDVAWEFGVVDHGGLFKLELLQSEELLHADDVVRLFDWGLLSG